MRLWRSGDVWGRDEFLSRYGGSAADSYYVVSELGLVVALALSSGEEPSPASCNRPLTW